MMPELCPNCHNFAQQYYDDLDQVRCLTCDMLWPDTDENGDAVVLDKKPKRFPALTLWQPWASLVAAGVKQYETRHWQPRSAPYPGDILMIHAAKSKTRENEHMAGILESQFPAEVSKAQSLWPGDYPRGAIVAAVRYIKVYPVEQVRSTISPSERMFGNYRDGRYAWKLELLKVPEVPIPAKGAQSVWWWSQ